MHLWRFIKSRLMLNNESLSVKRIYLLGAFVFLVTAWFSVGFNHFDEHFQILEFAGLKLGLTSAGNLPWEYGCMMRPAFQPGFVYLVYKAISVTGITDPFIIACIIRLFSAALTFLSILMMIKAFGPGIREQRLFKSFLLLSFFLWFIPYNASRFSSDTTSGVIFLIGLAWFISRDKLTQSGYLVTGLIMGISFITRYQVAFMILGFAAWLLFVKKARILNLVQFSCGIILAILIGMLIDRWFYGDWVLTSVNYFRQNLVLGKASAFGTSPWWYYFEQVFMNAIPPMSLVYIAGVILYAWYYPKDPVTWIIVPFLVIHFMIPHKEIRFLFPILGLLPIIIIRSADALLQARGENLPGMRLVKICIRLFWYSSMLMMVILAFRPADDQISLYKKLWYSYKTPVKLYFTEENPYHRAHVDVHFYKRDNLVFKQVDSVQRIVPSRDTISLVVTTIPGLPEDKRFNPVLIYSSLPPWVRNFNINHWIERTSFWYVYELKPV